MAISVLETDLCPGCVESTFQYDWPHLVYDIFRSHLGEPRNSSHMIRDYLEASEPLKELLNLLPMKYICLVGHQF